MFHWQYQGYSLMGQTEVTKTSEYAVPAGNRRKNKVRQVSTTPDHPKTTLDFPRSVTLYMETYATPAPYSRGADFEALSTDLLP
jgi:hypothetical protein